MERQLMGTPDFLVELIKAYAMILKAVWWPLVVLIIFFRLVFFVSDSAAEKKECL